MKRFFRPQQGCVLTSGASPPSHSGGGPAAWRFRWGAVTSCRCLKCSHGLGEAATGASGFVWISGLQIYMMHRRIWDESSQMCSSSPSVSASRETEGLTEAAAILQNVITFASFHLHIFGSLSLTVTWTSLYLSAFCFLFFISLESFYKILPYSAYTTSC